MTSAEAPVEAGSRPAHANGEREGLADSSSSAGSPASSGSERPAPTSSTAGGRSFASLASSQSDDDGSGVKLFLGGLAWETTEEKLREHFSIFGEITRVDVMKDRITGNPRGFGFVTFRDEVVAELVCKERHMIDGRQIDAKRSVPQGNSAPKPKSRKIFVGGLAPDTTDEQFREYFSAFGQVSDAQIMQDYTTSRSRGFGFVSFEEEAAVERVFQAGNMHTLAGKKVEVKTATPRMSGPNQQSGRANGRNGNGNGNSGGGRGGKGNNENGRNGNGKTGGPNHGYNNHGERMQGNMGPQPYGVMGQYPMQGYAYPMGFAPYGAPPYNGMMVPPMGYQFPQGYGPQMYGFVPNYNPQQRFPSGPPPVAVPAGQAPPEHPAATGVQ